MEEVPILMEHPRQELTREQKAGLSFVIFSGALGVLLGTFYMWHHMAIPFVVDYKGPRLLVGDDAANAAVMAEKQADTDGDGLSDYDEKNIYGTSPYLADTDSDGLTDQVEVTSGGDPLCATGKTCNATISSADVLTPPVVSAFLPDGLTEPVAPTVPDGLSMTGGTASSPTLTPADIEKLKALPIAQIRQILITSGADATKTNAMTDADVKAMYDSLLASLTPTP